MTIFAKSIDMNMEEKWKPVVGYEGLYEVSSLGRVRSLSRSIQGHKGYYVIPSRILKGFYAYGYRYVELHKGGNTRHIGFIGLWQRLFCQIQINTL